MNSGLPSNQNLPIQQPNTQSTNPLCFNTNTQILFVLIQIHKEYVYLSLLYKIIPFQLMVKIITDQYQLKV